MIIVTILACLNILAWTIFYVINLTRVKKEPSLYHCSFFSATAIYSLQLLVTAALLGAIWLGR